MKTTRKRTDLPLLIMALWLAFIGLGQFSVNSRAQEKVHLPARSGYVNDFAGVLDDSTKQRLEMMLGNLKQRSGIEFGVATLQSTGSRDIFDVSRDLASEWNLGVRNGRKKSLLLVVSVDEKTAFTQFTRAVQADLPEGILGELTQVMRGSLAAGHFNRGLFDGVTHFIDALGKRMGFTAQDFDQAQVASAALGEPLVAPSPDKTPEDATAKEAASPEGVASTRPRRTRKPQEEITELPKRSESISEFIAKSRPTPSVEPSASPLEPAASPAEPIASPVEPTASPVSSPAEPSASPIVSPAEPSASPVTSPAEPSATPAELTAAPAKTASSRRSTPTSKTTATRSKAKTPRRVNTAEDDADEAEEVELVLTLPLAERVPKLKAFLEAYPDSKSGPRAIELLISTHASLGDLKLKDGDRAAGLQELSLAISEAPTSIGDKLFANVVAQIPSNLYLRGERDAAYEAARTIETKFGGEAKRLLVLSAFYLGIEDGEEAARLAQQAVKLAPDMSDAHRALGLGLRIALRLDEAAAEYKRALELDPNTKQATRRSLADLSRASGKTEAALTLYREQLSVEPNDRAARAGVVLSLLELGQTEEGEKELDAALATDPPDLILLTGAAYWFAAHDDTQRALELAKRAVQVEPRYTWAQIALARALSGQRRPLEAERAIRFAAQYGKFPTLDYELATVLASLGLYDEAAEVIARTFSYEKGQISTRLAGRLLSQADTFSELLAPERRASIFQYAGAERPGEAATLKALLAFVVATVSSEAAKVDEAKTAAAAREFASGTDKMLTYRQLYAANRLIRLDVALPTALELTEAARGSVDAALEVPAATVAVQAEELRDARVSALARGGTPDVPDAPTNVLANIMRGRIEDLTGLALFKQDKNALSVDHFLRAVAILPEGTPALREALWHLGTALDQEQKQEEALTYYIRSYNAGEPDTLRRGIIERVYLKVNGSLTGLEARLSAGSTGAPADVSVASAPSPEPSSAAAEASKTSSPAESAPAMTPVSEPNVSPTPTARPTTTPEAAITPTATPEPSSAAPESPKPTPQPSRPGAVDSPVGEMLPTVPTTIKLTGKIKSPSGEPLANVVVVLISPRGTVLSSTTDNEGNFSFVVPTSSQAYRLIPSKDGFTFTPVDKVVTHLAEDKKDLDFVAEPAKPE